MSEREIHNREGGQGKERETPAFAGEGSRQCHEERERGGCECGENFQ